MAQANLKYALVIVEYFTVNWGKDSIHYHIEDGIEVFLVKHSMLFRIPLRNCSGQWQTDW